MLFENTKLLLEMITRFSLQIISYVKIGFFLHDKSTSTPCLKNLVNIYVNSSLLLAKRKQILTSKIEGQLYFERLRQPTVSLEYGIISIQRV